MKRKIIELLKKYTKHDYIELTSKGDNAIFAALCCAKKNNSKKLILAPEQGGWFSYLNYPKKLGFKLQLVKTDYGVIDLKELNKKMQNKNFCALIYANPAGYFAEQPVKEIYEACKKNNCLVILDASGSIGSEICNGEYADIIVGSFGKWKPVNLGYGGFLSAKEKKYFAFKSNIANFDEKYLPLLYEKLKNVKKRYKLFNRVNKKIKKDLNKFEILHKDKKGINVIVKFAGEKEKNKIIDYCAKNKYRYTICPRYIRVNENAVSIEVKRQE